MQSQLGLRVEQLKAPVDPPHALASLEATNLDDPADRLHVNVDVDLTKLADAPTALEFVDAPANELLVNRRKLRLDASLHRVVVKAAKGEQPHFELDAGASRSPSAFTIDATSGDIRVNRRTIGDAQSLPLGSHELLVRAIVGAQIAQRIYTIRVVDETSPHSGSVEGGGSIEAGEGDLAATPELMPRLETIAPANDHHDDHGAGDDHENEARVSTSDSGEESSASTITASLNVRSTSPTPDDGEPMHFEQAKYHFVVQHPRPHDEIGQLKVRGATGDRQLRLRLSPDQYRQWFGVDPTVSIVLPRDWTTPIFRRSFYIFAKSPPNCTAVSAPSSASQRKMRIDPSRRR